MPDKRTRHFTETLRHAWQHAGAVPGKALKTAHAIAAGCTIRYAMDRFDGSAHSGRSRKGFGTLEVVIIIAVILSIALLFRKTLSAYATNLINTVFAGDPLAN